VYLFPRTETQLLSPSHLSLSLQELLADMCTYNSLFSGEKGIFTSMATFLSGAVLKGHRGQVIVRLLNLMAIDKVMQINVKKRR
jgi:hypothetical protein